MDSEPPPYQTQAAYMALVVIWSTTPLSVVLSLRDMHPIWALGLRLALAAALALLLLRGLGLRLSRERQALHAYAWGAVSIFVAMAFTYLGAQRLPSGLIAVLFGMSPLAVALLSSVLLPGAALRGAQWLGMGSGLVGLMVIFDLGGARAPDRLGVLLVLLGVLSYAVSVVFLKRRSQALPPLVQTTGSLCLSVLACAVLLPFFAEHMPRSWPAAESLLAIVYSAVVGSIVAMLCYFFLVRRINVTSLSLTTVLTPVFALLLGVALNGERFSAGTALGMAIILLGLLLYFSREIAEARRGWWRRLQGASGRS